MNIDNFEHIADLLARSAAGTELQGEDKEVVVRWLEQSKRNRVLYDEILNGRVSAEYEHIISGIDPFKGMALVNRRIKLRRTRKLILSLSSAAVMAVGIFIYLFNVSEHRYALTAVADDLLIVLTTETGVEIVLDEHDDEESWSNYVDADVLPEPVSIKITVPKGKDYRVRLADGTVVIMNAETTMEYPSAFTGDRRAITLSGEAYLKVAHDSERPFEVELADDLSIRVLGTAFNLNNHYDTKKVHVTLVEGSLLVARNDRQIMLEPYQQAVFDRNTDELTMREVTDMKAYTAWTEGQFYYRSTSLDEIFIALERWYDIDIHYSPADIPRIGDVNLVFNRSDSLNYVMRSLGNITGINYRIKDRDVYIDY